uniref:Uncharacterized protein n=1 Tax=Pygocentrus nattereri TaxID=42514 RepID=A0AAR2J544_PYGNA
MQLASTRSANSSNSATLYRNFLLCPICKKTHWSLPVHLRRSCMRTSSEADILAVVESAKRAVSNLLRTGRVWEYSLLSRIMQSPDTIDFWKVTVFLVKCKKFNTCFCFLFFFFSPDTTKQGTSLRERMASLGYYKKHSLDHDLLVSFAKFLQFDMSNENFKQEVENVARFLYFMDPQQASLLFGLIFPLFFPSLRFLKFHTGSTDLCFTDRVLHEDCKNYISFLDNIQMATSKQYGPAWLHLNNSYIFFLFPVLIIYLISSTCRSDQSDTPRGSSAYLTDQAAYDKLLRSYPVTLDGVPPNRSQRKSLAGEYERYCYDRWRSEQLERRVQHVLEHFARRLPSESRVKAWIEKQGWSANLPDAASIVQQWKPSGGIDVAMDSVVLQKFTKCKIAVK